MFCVYFEWRGWWVRGQRENWRLLQESSFGYYQIRIDLYIIGGTNNSFIYDWVNDCSAQRWRDALRILKQGLHQKRKINHRRL